MAAFDYTSRDYNSIRADLFARASEVLPEWTSRDSSDFGVLFVDLVAYMGDIFHYYLDEAAKESFLDTATRRSSLLAIASLLDYLPHGRTPAKTSITLNAAASVATNAVPILIPANTKFVARPLISTAEEVAFTSNTSIAFNADGTSVAGYTTYAKASPATLQLTEGELFTETFTSNGALSQKFTLAKLGVVVDSVTVSVAEGLNGAAVSYGRVDRFIESTSSVLVFTTRIKATDEIELSFGNAIHGKIPTTNAVVTIGYRRSRGTAGNVEANSVKAFASLTNAFGPAYDGVVITPNTTRAFGGSDSESIASLKNNIPTSFRSQDRAVSLSDYQELTLRVPGIVKAKSEVVAAATAKQGVITNKAKSTTVATLTTSAAHGLSVDEYVAIFGVDDTFNGTYVVASIPTSTTFTYSLTGSTVSSVAVTTPATFKNAQVKLYALITPDVYDGLLVSSPTISPLTLNTHARDLVYAYISPREIVGVNSVVMPSVALSSVKITCAVSVLTNFVQTNTQEAVTDAVKELFVFDKVFFGQTLTLGALYRTILAVPGVDYVNITKFTTGSSAVIDTASLSPNVQGVQASTNALLLLTELTVSATGGIASV